MKQIPFGAKDIVVLPAMLCKTCGVELSVRVQPVIGIISRGSWPTFKIIHPANECQFAEQITEQPSQFYSGVRI